jgi:hypothetical protein
MFALLFWSLLVFEFLFGISETSLCSMSPPQANIVLLLDALQLLMLSVGKLTSLESKLFFLIVFYSASFFIIKY